MRKLFTLMLILVLSLSLLAGCGSDETEPTDAGNEEQQETSENQETYVDGNYNVTYSHVDSHGWRPILEVIIKDEKISSAKMDYINPEGNLKSEDENYANAMKNKSDITPSEAFNEMNERLVEKQDIANVDTVTGATGSSESFTKMVQAALENAKSGDTSEIVLPMNDTYTAAEKDFDDHGWKASVSITFEDGNITEVEYNEIDKDGNLKKDDKEYNKSMAEKSGISAKDAMAQLEASLIEKQDVESIDAITGATGTVSRFKTLVNEALNQRVPYNK